jgi:hypothetical protein
VQNALVSTPDLPPVDLDRIERALGWRPTRWTAASARKGGATAARLLVSSAGERAFVKLGTTELTAGWFRREHENYLTIAGPFLPRLLGFSDDGLVPVLAIEDLSDATLAAALGRREDRPGARRRRTRPCASDPVAPGHPHGRVPR